MWSEGYGRRPRHVLCSVREGVLDSRPLSPPGLDTIEHCWSIAGGTAGRRRRLSQKLFGAPCRLGLLSGSVTMRIAA